MSPKRGGKGRKGLGSDIFLRGAASSGEVFEWFLVLFRFLPKIFYMKQFTLLKIRFVLTSTISYFFLYIFSNSFSFLFPPSRFAGNERTSSLPPPRSAGPFCQPGYVTKKSERERGEKRERKNNGGGGRQQQNAKINLSSPGETFYGKRHIVRDFSSLSDPLLLLCGTISWRHSQTRVVDSRKGEGFFGQFFLGKTVSFWCM